MPFSPPRFGYLSSHCLSACWERRKTCTEDVLWVYLIHLLFEQFWSPGTRLHSGFISTQAFSWQAIHVKLIWAQAARLVINTFFSSYPVLVQSVRPLVINTDHSFTPWSVASSLSHTHFSTHISCRAAVVFLLLQLHTCLVHGVFSQAIIAAGERSPWSG